MVRASGVHAACMIAGCGRPARARGLCVRHYNAQYYHGRPVPDRLLRSCLECGGEFEAKRRSAVFCSHRCRTRWYRRVHGSGMPSGWNLSEVMRAKPSESVQVGLARSIPAEFFTVDDVWAKSPSTCILCGEPLDRSLPPWDAMAGVPDWIVPPKDGGELTLENRIIVHRSCWSRKVRGNVDARNGRNASVAYGRSGKEGQ